jgi:hypothetical protein
LQLPVIYPKFLVKYHDSDRDSLWLNSFIHIHLFCWHDKVLVNKVSRELLCPYYDLRQILVCSWSPTYMTLFSKAFPKFHFANLLHHYLSRKNQYLRLRLHFDLSFSSSSNNKATHAKSLNVSCLIISVQKILSKTSSTQNRFSIIELENKTVVSCSVC